MSGKNANKKIYWKAKINEYNKTGVGKSKNKWCRENNINPKKFNYWCCKLKKSEVGKLQYNNKEEQPNSTKWIPISIMQEKDELKETNENRIIINIGKARIEVNKGFDSKCLIDVVRVVNLLC